MAVKKNETPPANPITEQNSASANENRDWFLSAVVSDGSVGRCLRAVVNELSRKQAIISAIEQKLCQPNLDEIDRLSGLGKDVKELENTLRFRLGLLRVDQQAVWFRKAPRKDYGPFRSSMLMEPVFAPYRVEEIDLLKSALKQRWEKSETGPLPFQDESPCLWRVLLEKKKAMSEMARLEGAFANLNLAILPEGLPKDLESRAFRAFLLNVHAEFAGVRERLNICFDQLWNTCEKFWLHQKEEAKQPKQKSASAESSYSAPKDSRAKTGQGAQSEDRGKSEESYSERELQASFSRMEALSFMGFRQTPSKEILRKRYLEMAKSLHPDRGGSEDSFKRLSRAYRELTENLD